MNEFDRTELKMILEGLDVVRNRMREEIELLNLKLPDLSGQGSITEDSEYNKLVRLQDRIIDALESRFY
jgi:hypothetical protein